MMERPTKTARQLLEAKHADVTGVISVAPGDTVLSALQLMQEKDIGAVVVLEGETSAHLRGSRGGAGAPSRAGREFALTLDHAHVSRSAGCSSELMISPVGARLQPMNSN